MGILFARDLGIEELNLEGDSLMVSNIVASISHIFLMFEVSHVGRKGNKPVYLLTKHA